MGTLGLGRLVVKLSSAWSVCCLQSLFARAVTTLSLPSPQCQPNYGRAPVDTPDAEYLAGRRSTLTYLPSR